MHRISLRLLTAIILGGSLFIIGWSAWHSFQLAQAFKHANWNQAARSAKLAHPPVKVMSVVTGHAVPDLEVWNASLELSQSALRATVLSNSSSVGSDSPTGVLFDGRPFLTELPAINTQVGVITDQLPRTWVIRKWLPAPLLQLIPSSAKLLSQLTPTLQSLTTGTHRWLVLFQNHHELRPTGGFMGSYAVLTVVEGQLLEVAVEDIYDADGQFTGYIAAPPGVQEYLSSNHGLRLPDANWDADFPTSAQTVLKYFALSDRTHIDLVAAVTLDLAQQILAVTGPIYLPDYQTSVNSETLPTVLGSHRNNYFPGSIQKKHMLAHLLTQLRLTAGKLSQTQITQLLNLAHNSFQAKSIQIFGVDPVTQSQLVDAGVSGALPGGTQDLVALVEANVGINKSNRAVTRSYDLDLDQYRVGVSTLFTNGNAPLDAQALANLPASSSAHLAYVNYQRVLVPASWQVSEITFDGQSISDWHERIFQTDTQTLKEIGLLIVVPELSSRRLSLEFSTPPFTQDLILFKQAGVPPSAYSVKRASGQVESGILESDVVLAR